MFWTSAFIISIFQGLFLISLIFIKGKKNRLASGLIIGLLGLMILTNFGYFVVRTDLRNHIPQFFAIPFGMILLFGPLFYFYSKSVIDNSFKWKPVHFIHFIPYLLQLSINFPVLTADQQSWNWFINCFLNGSLPIRTEEKITLALQDIHLGIYLFATFKWIQQARSSFSNARFIISVSIRINWLKKLLICLSLFLATVVTLYIFILVQGKYQPVTNYIYTLVSSAIIYFVAYGIVLNPELISPHFALKYKTYMQFSGEDGDKYLDKLKMLMDVEQVFTNPDLKLAALAKEVGLPSHQLSKLINEKFDKSFTDYVNEYRIQAFIKKMEDPANRSYTIYGMALDVGFNTKSSFNAAFKKITGKTPSEFKPA